jgi:hypothetical protein
MRPSGKRFDARKSEFVLVLSFDLNGRNGQMRSQARTPEKGISHFSFARVVSL